MKWLQKILLVCGAFLGVAVLLAITAVLFLFALSSPVELSPEISPKGIGAYL